MYGNESGGTLAAGGIGVLLVGWWLPVTVSVVLVVIIGSGFMIVAWRRRGNRNGR